MRGIGGVVYGVCINCPSRICLLAETGVSCLESRMPAIIRSMNTTPRRLRRKGIGCLGCSFCWCWARYSSSPLRVHADRKALYAYSQGRNERADLEKYG
jgi:hypothetical protein